MDQELRQFADEVLRRLQRIDDRMERTDARLDALENRVEELKRHFDVTAEFLRTEIALVAESVMNLDQKLDRTAADIRAEMRTGFAETHALINYRHASLDRQLSSLETRVN